MLLAARVAAAKAYKQQQQQQAGGGAGTSGDEASSQETLSEAQQAELLQQHAAQLRQQQQELAAQGSEYTQLLQQQQQERVSTLDRLAAADPGLQQPSERGSPARSDFYTSRDAPGVDALLGSTPRRRGAGSAEEPADWLKGVLSTPPAAAGAGGAGCGGLCASSRGSGGGCAGCSSCACRLLVWPCALRCPPVHARAQVPPSTPTCGQRSSQQPRRIK